MKFIRQIADCRPIAICMALLVLVSTTGFTVSAHFCGGEFQQIAFFGQAESCEAHVKQLPPCHHQDTGAEAEKKSCCEDQTIVKDGQESLKETVVLKELKPDLTYIAVVASFLLAIISTSTPYSFKFHHYSPPLIERNIPVFVQSFLL